MDVNNDAVNDTNFTWKANNHGPVKIQIAPQHPKYLQNSSYNISVHPYRVGTNNFSIKLTMIEALPIEEI